MIDEELDPQYRDEEDDNPQEKQYEPPLGPDGQHQHLPHEAWHIDQPVRRRRRILPMENMDEENED